MISNDRQEFGTPSQTPWFKFHSRYLALPTQLMLGSIKTICPHFLPSIAVWSDWGCSSHYCASPPGGHCPQGAFWVCRGSAVISCLWLSLVETVNELMASRVWFFLFIRGESRACRNSLLLESRSQGVEVSGEDGAREIAHPNTNQTALMCPMDASS